MTLASNPNLLFHTEPMYKSSDITKCTKNTQTYAYVYVRDINVYQLGHFLELTKETHKYVEFSSSMYPWKSFKKQRHSSLP